MAALDEVAKEEGKTVLVLDTVTGGDAERLYERAGWQRAGVVPKYALMPDGAAAAAVAIARARRATRPAAPSSDRAPATAAADSSPTE